MHRRVLVNDVDLEFHGMVSRDLGWHRVAVVCEPDVERALARLAAGEAFDIVMTAVEEPDKAGFKALTRFRKVLPKHVPSFAAVLWGRVAPGFPLGQMFATARTVKGRRGQEFTAAEEALYLDLYEQTRLERERAFQRAADRREDRWPVSALGL